MPQTKDEYIYQIKVNLQNTKPPIWRRLLVRSTVKLGILHYILQTSMSWMGGHLHDFEQDGIRYENKASTDITYIDKMDTNAEVMDEEKVSLSQLLHTVKDRLNYTYDFGDDWAHLIVLEKILPMDSETQLPSCIGGKREAPPEDCGGVWGYTALLAVLADPKHEDHAEMLEWLELDSADQWDAAYFNVTELNAELSTLSKY